MRAFPRAAFVAAILFTMGWSVLELRGGGTAAKASQTPTTTPPPKPPVYVSDFEIDVVPSPAAAQTPENDPRKAASQLVQWMSKSTVAALQKAGYTATRMHAGDARPGSGAQIRGLFAEVDSENHWRRAVIRDAQDSGKMEAFVAVANLAKPELALYEFAPLQGNVPGPGAVITLSPYVPLTKYDVSKDANEDAFRRIASQIVKDLTDLLQRNPFAIRQ
jgi:hypothetical protein